MEYTIVVCGIGVGTRADAVHFAYAATAIGEYFRDSKRHALVIYDDLSKHGRRIAKFLCCCGGRLGARRIPETCSISTRACWSAPAKMSDKLGGGSLTALPIIERRRVMFRHTFRPTSSPSLTARFIWKPIVQPGRSSRGERRLVVSRVGGSAQIKAMRQVAGT